MTTKCFCEGFKERYCLCRHGENSHERGCLVPSCDCKAWCPTTKSDDQAEYKRRVACRDERRSEVRVKAGFSDATHRLGRHRHRNIEEHKPERR